jgi:hypothetical protein
VPIERFCGVQRSRACHWEGDKILGKECDMTRLLGIQVWREPVWDCHKYDYDIVNSDTHYLGPFQCPV